MRTKSLFLFLFTGVVLFSSCEPNDPPSSTNRDYRPTPNNPGVGSLVAPPAGIRCPDLGRNCFLYLQEGDYPIFTRQVFNNFITDTKADDLSHFFANNNWRVIFPEWSEINEDAVQKIISKEYGIKIFADSSVAVLRNPASDLSEANVLYAIGK
jgi:hypothetical protein